MKGCLGVAAVAGVVLSAAGLLLRPYILEVAAFLRHPASVFPDGTAVNPEAYRALLLNSTEQLEALERTNATWRAVVERGSVEELQGVFHVCAKSEGRCNHHLLG